MLLGVQLMVIPLGAAGNRLSLKVEKNFQFHVSVVKCDLYFHVSMASWPMDAGQL